MKRLFIGIIILVIAAIAISVYAVRQHILAQAGNDVTDRDFIATISSTDTPLLVSLNVRKVNPRAQKQIKSLPIAVDFILEDSTGRVYRSEYLGQSKYAFQVSGSAFDMNRGPANEVSGKVRIVTKSLKAGTYKVTPVVRIVETGKAASKGPYNDCGSVAVPAKNSISIVIK
jgi:hypothetical protein